MIQKVDESKCVGCGRCVSVCPLDVIRLKDEKAKITYSDDCMTCYLCEHVCPKGAIFVHPFKEAPPPVFPGIVQEV